ncbi:hypothetical protein ACLHDG_04560 [Sulfurovum sp. CS9]|uniref:hypothetical protein n=1 Tax=Sulfurovum sp. CS9 TaxID=3391146 RepID=UPI0039EABA4C
MNIVRTHGDPIISLDYISIVMLLLPLSSLSIVALYGSLAPISIFFLMVVLGSILIVVFSNKSEIFLKIKLFVFFFSLYLTYSLINYYILLEIYPNKLPFGYVDEKTLYSFSNFGLPYISGEKSFFDIFSVFKLSELPLHTAITSVIAYLSILIDGANTVMVQKLLSPFLGGLFAVVLYSTLKYQFTDRNFSLNAVFAYSLLSAVFIYSTPMLRDIDVALAYMIFFYLFLQKNSIGNLLLLFLVSYITMYLRTESGMVLLALILLYIHFYARDVQSKVLKSIIYIMSIILISFVLILMYNMVMGKIISLHEGTVTRTIAAASSDSIGVLFNKLPFGVSHTAKVLFAQILPFPFFHKLAYPPYIISGIFWPFIFIMMLYVIMKKNIRVLVDEKVKYLLLAVITVLYLMSGEPLTRRMMAVFPIIYIVSLYAFIAIPKNKIKKIISYYFFGMISLTVLYYFIKI